MPAHERVRAWIAHNYQKPVIDQEWLADCADWVASEFSLEPARDFDQFIQHVEQQLLQSNLADSTVPESGIDPLLFTSVPAQLPNVRRPARRAPPQKKTSGPTPLLVEIKSITEIAHSAFSLLNTHQTRLDRADLGLAHDENPEQPRDEDEGPIPRFPRGMLKFELSDGLTTFSAIEFRSLPQLELGTTPLGYKMLLKSTPIRNGIAFLEPANVVLKGYRTEDHDINSEQVFLSSLRRRLGQPDPPPEAATAGRPQENLLAQPPPYQPMHQHQAPAAQPRPPPTDYDDMYVDDDVDPDVLRETLVRLDEDNDVQKNQRPSPSKRKANASSDTKPTSNSPHDIAIASRSLQGQSTSSSTKTSSYFTVRSSESKPIPNLGLSPRPTSSRRPDPDFDITWDLDDAESSNLLAKEHGPTYTRPSPSAQSIPSPKRASSPDPFDDISFDMDVDESFLEQVGMIEQNALGTRANSKGKGKAKEIIEQPTTSHSRPREAGKKASSGLASGTKPLAINRLSPSSAERNTMAHSSTTRATSTSSLSGSAETPMPQSTQSSSRRLPRDPSLIVISSSEDEAPRGHSMAKPLSLARRRAPKRKAMDQDDVIDISD